MDATLAIFHGAGYTSVYKVILILLTDISWVIKVANKSTFSLRKSGKFDFFGHFVDRFVHYSITPLFYEIPRQFRYSDP